MEKNAIVIYVIILLVLFFVIWNNIQLQKTKKLNLGKPIHKIDEAIRSLSTDCEVEIILLHSFIPDTIPDSLKYFVQPIWETPTLGCGLISNPEIPDQILFTNLVFSYNEKIILGRKYKILKGDRDQYSLKLVKEEVLV